MENYFEAGIENLRQQLLLSFSIGWKSDQIARGINLPTCIMCQFGNADIPSPGHRRNKMVRLHLAGLEHAGDRRSRRFTRRL